LSRAKIEAPAHLRDRERAHVSLPEMHVRMVVSVRRCG
jgi:hypothetical protein